MDYTNINDPAGVKALLDQLRESQAWQDLDTETGTNLSSQDSTTMSNHPPQCPTEQVSEPEPALFVSDHISSLLSRLQPGGGITNLNQPPSVVRSNPHVHDPRTTCSVPIRSPPSVQSKHSRFLTFNQALPLIAQLADSPVFMENLEKMRVDQVHLEEKLWEARAQILKNQEEKVKIAQARAAIVGVGLSQSDACALENSFLKELRAFDCEQALPAWDALVAKQQNTLEAFDVPSMFVTAHKADREKQQRIIQVLDGLSGPESEYLEP